MFIYCMKYPFLEYKNKYATFMVNIVSKMVVMVTNKGQKGNEMKFSVYVYTLRILANVMEYRLNTITKFMQATLSF